MNAQQLYDYIIKPAHNYMGGNYESKNANFLSLCTAAIESNCGEYIKQINGPALGIWQMEPDTYEDIWDNCDALDCNDFTGIICSFQLNHETPDGFSDECAYANEMIVSPMYACAMARLKYAMDKEPLPGHNNLRAVYDYYKRIYNTELGASTWEKFQRAIKDNKILEIKL